MYIYRPNTDNAVALAQMIKNSLKEEILNELRTQQRYNFMPEPSRWETEKEKSLEIRGRPRKRESEPEEMSNLCIGNMEGMLLNEPNILCYMDQIIRGPGAKTTFGGFSQEKGILYGIGTVAFLGLLFPSFGRKIQTVLNRTALEGLELINKARSVVARAKEDMEDLMAEASLLGLTKKPRR